MKKSVALQIGILLIFLAMNACYYDHAETLYHITPVDCTQINALFTQDISPIIELKCATAGCHDASTAGSTALRNYDEIKSKVDRINQRVLIDKNMPPGGGLTSAQLNQLKCWIQNGALNN